MEDDRNGGDLNDDEEGLEMEGADNGEVGDPEKETETSGDPRKQTMVIGTQQEEAGHDNGKRKNLGVHFRWQIGFSGNITGH